MTDKFIVKLKKLPFREFSNEALEYPVFNFHINGNARKKYSFTKTIFSTSGNVVFADFSAAKDFAVKMNSYNRAHGIPGYISAGDIYAMSLIDEIYHFIIYSYRENNEPGLLKRLYEKASKTIGGEKVSRTVKCFISDFMPPAVEDGFESVDDYLKKDFSSVTGEIIEFEEMLTLKLANENPAFSRFRELFDDTNLDRSSSYREIFSIVEDSLEDTTEITVGEKKLSLIELLRVPMKTHPHSLSDQLKYIVDEWGFEMIGSFARKLLTAVDVIKEEENRGAAPGGSFSEVVTADILSFPWGDEDSSETENFSTDSLWMPRVVMVAKNVFVWMDQLSKLYSKEINTLDQIPDDELKIMGGRGFTALWLIGLWERSRASRKIKQLMGNPEAVASAYSLYDYVIAEDLGGEKAFSDLKQRAWRYGLRVASDMVPNHMAIDSKWVNEHPEWFLSLDEPPFPGYSYNGTDLSSDSSIVIQIDDKYYDKTDAAVTFKRIDRRTGETKYIYHGNDGTCMPWNDTAQLNYMKTEVREQVIRTIIEIARNFPIIRFDAAMTLAKKHYQRLWFPEPGTGGDIPSRAEHGMTKQEFNKFFPKEFWREVVDRVAQEVPETLLLAEAFWLMEGYFVRTLGMHRVYNSAFMNFLKDEENAKYRESIKNVLEFDPHILERHVNFLNNPDEETAVKQFGKGDKYFGVTMMMVTMPGLPMFGHGQVEGYSEKYGMEYRRAYWNESVDWELVKRHEKEIFPLVHRRKLFAHVDNFNLFDLYRADGSVDENLFAFTNGYNDKRVLVLYHNKYAETSGWIHTSAPCLDKINGQVMRKSLKEALSLQGGDGIFVVFRDCLTNDQFIRNVRDLDEKGMYVSVAAYKYQVFTDFYEVKSSEKEPWDRLCSNLNGRGTKSLENDMNAIVYSDIHHKFKKFSNPETFERLAEERSLCKKKTAALKFYRDLSEDYGEFLKEICNLEGYPYEDKDIPQLFIKDILAVINLPDYKLDEFDKEADKYLHDNLSGNRDYLFMVLGFTLVARLSMLVRDRNEGPESCDMLRKYGLDVIFSDLFEKSGISSFHAGMIARHIRAFVFYQNWWRHYDSRELLPKLMKDVMEDENMISILQMNEYEEKIWFNKESFENFIAGLFVVSVLELLRNISKKNEKAIEFKKRFGFIRTMLDMAEKSGYEKERFLKLLEKVS